MKQRARFLALALLAALGIKAEAKDNDAIIINEVMASNVGSVMSPAFNFDGWIELYNPSGQAINLKGMILSDGYGNRWEMPNDIGDVPAKGFKVMWLGSHDIELGPDAIAVGQKQAPFKLDCDGGTISLSNAEGTLITSMTYPEAKSRTSYARTTDGGNDWSWTASPTPGATNATSAFATKRLDPPEVNQGSQLFTERLTISVDIPEGTTLMYTTDGTVPTVATTVPNVSARESKDGQFTISTTTNYVFRLFRDGYLPSVPVTRSYIKTNDTYTIPIISIVGDEKYFSDPKTGIDCDGDGTNGKTGNGQDQPRNYNMPWDRPVNFSYISPTEGMLYNQDANISISGGWTRSASPRSMKLKSNKAFDGQNRFDYAFFPQKPYIRSKTLLIRNGGNDVWENHGRFTDPALTTIIQRSGIDLDVQSFVQVVEYINGRRRGVLNLREPNNDKFVYANWGYDDEDIDMFENSEFTNGNDAVYRHLCQLSEHINDEGVYDEVKTLLDIDEFTNYMATELFLGNDDWPDNNVKGYRSQQDGRFRFVCYDLDYSFNKWNHRISSLNDYTDVAMVKLFLNLLKHDEYRKKFIDTFCIVGGSVFERQRATAIVDELADAMRPMSQYDGYLPDNAANKIKSQLQIRLVNAINQLQQFAPMKLSNARKQNVQFYADTEGATLLLNGINVPYAAFNGRLFAPVTLEAKAPTGYKFAGWKKSSNTSVSLIKRTDSWKYYDKGEAASGWKNANFDDSRWTSGYAPLGYAMSGISTTIGYGPNANQKYITTYFRKNITLNSTPTAKDAFMLDYEVDDGFVIYVNGTEAARVNMNSGTIGFDTTSQTYADSTPMTGTIELPTSLFHSGTNVIAVEVHNTSRTSSDLFWAAALQATVSTAAEEIVSTEAVLELPDDATIALTACFDPLTDAETTAMGITPVRINEVSADDGIYVNDYFKRKDWVELYNTTSEPIDVEGMFLIKGSKNPKKYEITKGVTTANTIIPAHGYLIIWCDKEAPLVQLHATFGLDNDGDELRLMAADESWTDLFTFPAHKSDQTVGRYPDGASDIFVMNVPTIAKANIRTTYAEPVINVTNPDGVNDIMAEQENSSSEHIYNLKGQVVKGALAPGIYIKGGKKFIVR